jgi:uncharacterized protein
MAMQTVQAVVRFIRDVPVAREPLGVVWHAGEPLAVPTSFYESAFECFASDPEVVPVRQHIQTNGVLIDDSWCSLFKRWSVYVGISIDGPKIIHDSHRVDRAGRGTFDRVMRGIAKLHEHEIPFSVLAVLTRESLSAADELWEFLASLRISGRVGFNVEEAEGVHGASSMTGNGRLAAFRKFMSRLAELHQKHSPIRIREFESMRRHLSAPRGADVARSDNRPGAILNVDVEGNLSTFSPELLGVSHPLYGKFWWGNVHTNSWAEIAENPGFRRAHADIAAGIELCRQSCQYFSVCGGGCPSNKLAELGTFAGTETDHCRFHVQAIADVVMEKVEREMALTHAKNDPVLAARK